MRLDDFTNRHGLPKSYAASAENHYLPFADWLYGRIGTSDGNTFVLGINGAQGTGKSTCADLIKEYLAAEHDLCSVVLSIDDIYLTQRERRSLALNVHPLLATRGVPGTHDVALGLRTIEQLKSLGAHSTMKIPRFDKSSDDRFPESDWPVVSGPVDLVIFEGWCVASQPCEPPELEQPVNLLESAEDTDAAWRAYVNERLKAEYKVLFAMLDALLFLKAPNFEVVYQWRLQQEHKLRARRGSTAKGIMSDAEVAKFIRFYERITKDNLRHLPNTADAVIELGVNHSAVATTFRAC